MQQLAVLKFEDVLTDSLNEKEGNSTTISSHGQADEELDPIVRTRLEARDQLKPEKVRRNKLLVKQHGRFLEDQIGEVLKQKVMVKGEAQNLETCIKASLKKRVLKRQNGKETNEIKEKIGNALLDKVLAKKESIQLLDNLVSSSP